MNKPSIYYVYVGYLLAIPAIHAVAVSQGLALEEAVLVTGFAALVGNVIGAVITVFIRDSSHIMINVSAATLAACAALAFTSDYLVLAFGFGAYIASGLQKEPVSFKVVLFPNVEGGLVLPLLCGLVSCGEVS